MELRIRRLALPAGIKSPSRVWNFYCQNGSKRLQHGTIHEQEATGCMYALEFFEIWLHL